MVNVLIKADKINKTYKLFAEEVKAVKDVDLEILQGEFIAIMGPSGSGKTTLLDILGCLDRVSSGKLQVLDNDVSVLKESSLVKIRRANIGFVFQEFLLIPTLTALENVELPLLFGKLPQDRNKAIKLLQMVGLGNRVNHLPKELSGGERQRVAIARALVTSPKILFADEPTGNLDTKSGQQIFDIFKELNQKDGLTIVLTTHNNKLGLQAKRIVYLKDGHIVSKEESSLYA
ncbi:MAG: ABC transporter ATP-binding protein [Candidatus Omnitrophica bacterium]|nr:ABC transporter ATP-binding protein [Candidatus Omnitrophota bacterium]MBU1923011.1 ABC transporter ATP-binding protein [Candidatus Omnitrophota bacterium]